MGRLIRNGTEYCGGGGGDNSRTMSYAEYQNLSDAEKNSNTTFYIPDYPGTNSGSGSEIEIYNKLIFIKSFDPDTGTLETVSVENVG